MQDGNQTGFVDQSRCFIESEPFGMTLAPLAPLLALFIHREEKNIDTAEVEMRFATLEVVVMPYRPLAYLANDPSLFEGFLRRGFPRLTPFHRPPFGYDPPFRFAGSEQQNTTDAVVAHRNRQCGDLGEGPGMRFR